MKLFGNSKGGKWAGSSDKQRRFDFDEIPTDSVQTEPEQELEPIIRSVISKTEVDLTADQPVAVRRKQSLPQETPQADMQNHYKPLHQPQPATEPEQEEEAEGMAGWVKGLILLTASLAIFIVILVLVGNQLMSLTALATALFG